MPQQLQPWRRRREVRTLLPCEMRPQHCLQSNLSLSPADWELMVQRKLATDGGFYSSDALDLGEALQVAVWHPQEPWSGILTDGALRCLEALWQHEAFDLPDSQRLAFREFGTTIGAQVSPAARPAWRERVLRLHAHWRGALFSRDKDITPVMAATSLLPGALSRAYDALPPMSAEGGAKAA